MKLKLAIGTGIGLLHAVLQFYAWATAMRPTSRVAWQILSAPAFPVVGEDIATLYFWPVLLLNSAIWGVGGGMLLRLLVKKPE